MRKYTLSKSETLPLIEFVSNKWPKSVVPEKLKIIETIETEENQSVLIGENFLAVKADNVVLPLLANEEVLKAFPSVSVDMGAVKFVCNGARVMRPGIVRMDEFSKDDIVVVKDDTHGKFLAVGVALVSSKEAHGMTKGYVIDNRHYISDKLWETYKQGK